MPALTPQPGQHVAGLYSTDGFLAGRVAAFITEGLTAGEQVIVLATASRWTAISGRLAETGLALRRAVSEGQLLLLDATEVLDGLTVDGCVSVDGFRAALTRFIVPATPQRMYGVRVLNGPFLQGRQPAGRASTPHASRARFRRTCHPPLARG